jgi:signal transduction histidine kinase
MSAMGKGQYSSPDFSEFLLRACHDLRAPLRAVRAHAELLLRDEPTSTAVAERLGFIVDGARKIDLLVDALSRYSIALQISPGSFQSTSMDLVLRSALSRLDREVRANDAVVTYDKLPRVNGNPDRLIELLENLLRNALRHRGLATPSIHVAAEEQAEGWLFAVRDNGPGVEDEYLERIFEPYVRIHPELHAAAGMGLAICRVIVERHGGRIWAESRPAGGAAFFFCLPAN